MRLRQVATVGPRVAGLGREDVGKDVSFLPLDRIWADQRFDPSEIFTFTGDVKSYNPVAEGDLLIPKVTPTFSHGRVAIARGLTNRLALATSEVFVVRPHEPHATSFLRYRLLAADFRSEGEASLTGVAGLKRISSDFLRNVPIDRRGWRERHTVADFLDRECGRMSLLADRLEKLALRAEEPVLAELDRLLAGWPPGRVGYRFEVQLGKMLDEKRVDPTQLAPYLRNANVHWDRILLDDVKQMSFDASERRKFRLLPGDLLVCEGGEPGRAAIWEGRLECYYQKALHRVRPRGEDSTRFLLWCLRSLASRGAFGADGPGRYMHLTAEDLRATEVALPPPAVQHETAAKLDARGGAARALRDHCALTTERLAEYRDALITEAVTGQLDVTRLSDSQLDESAHAALEGERPEVLSA